MITGRNKRTLEDHFDRQWELEAALELKGDLKRLAAVRKSADLANVHYVRQGDPRGLGHAVLCAKQHVGDQPFAVLLGDDLIDARDPLLQPMIDIQKEYGGSVIALIEVPPAQISLYGCAAVEATDVDGLLRITDLVEKPAADAAPSNYAVIGRYVLSPGVFDSLERTEPGQGGEIQLTDALRDIISREPMHGLLFRGRRYDTGDRADYLKAIVQLACDRADLGPEFLEWLGEFVRTRTAAGAQSLA
jgi:UTP--glucose-1-phosphate uridylyltransferase